jgi:excisionase family DNA binding protein
VFSMQENINQDRCISLQEVCVYLGVKCHTAKRCIDQRGMYASNVGKLWCFKVVDLNKWVKRAGSPMSGGLLNDQI